MVQACRRFGQQTPAPQQNLIYNNNLIRMPRNVSIFRSTAPGQPSFRPNNAPSVFVKFVCDELKSNYRTHYLTRMYKNIERKVSALPPITGPNGVSYQLQFFWENNLSRYLFFCQQPNNVNLVEEYQLVNEEVE